jgi:cytochrome P450
VLVSEIERVCGARPPNMADIPLLEWCKAVIDETQRLYPAVGLTSRQARNADRIGGIDIKPASVVLLAPWLLHRAEDLWESPHHFRPERFLDGKRPAPYTYIPFSAGPRICTGLHFASAELVLCLATLLQRFRIRVVPDVKVEPMSIITVHPRNGMPVTIAPR